MSVIEGADVQRIDQGQELADVKRRCRLGNLEPLRDLVHLPMADWMKTMTYPGGEAVTTVYNDQGLPETLTGSQLYVTEAGYNALGQKKRYTLGNAVSTWTYYGESRAAVLRHPCPVDRL